MRIVLVANTDWYLYNYRLPLAEAARARGDEVVCLCPPGPFLARLEERGFRCLPWPLSRQVSGPGRALAEMRALARELGAIQPDLAHFFTTKPILHGGMVLRWMHRPCAVVNAPTGLGPAFATPGARAALARAAIVRLYRGALNGRGVENILQNPDDLSDLQRFGALRGDNHHLIRGSGVSTVRFREQAAVAHAVPRVLMATRINVFKGVREYAQANRLLRQRGVAVEFLLAGSPDRGNFSAIRDEELQAWTAEGLVRHLGHQDRMEDVLREVDIVALPTYNREGVPRILVEAAAMGKPLVATDVPGCREIVRHGRNGLLVPARDAEALAAAIGSLAGDGVARARMGACGRQIVVQEFGEEMVLRRTLQVYDLARQSYVGGGRPATGAAAAGAALAGGNGRSATPSVRG